MPYIPQKDREPAIDMFADSGDFAFKLTDDILEHLSQRFQLDSTPRRFQHYASAVGVIELVKLELWRRLIVPYEEEKIKKDGDVF